MPGETHGPHSQSSSHLEICSKSAGNVIITDAVMYVRARVSEGKNMAEPLTERKVFPAMVVQMIGVGEQTGALDQMLNKVADFYEDEVETTVKSLTSVIEPILLVVLGGVIAFLVTAMYLPIFTT